MSPLICPICGAKIRSSDSHSSFKCDFCHFERIAPQGKPTLTLKALEQSLGDLPHLLKITNCSAIHVDTMGLIDLEPLTQKYPVVLKPLADDAQNIEAIWADMTLPYINDLSGYLSHKFHQLNKGGLLYLSLPVKRPFLNTPALPGQINIFMPKNIMFLLEQRGFKMAWRKNRLSPTLRLIARKD